MKRPTCWPETTATDAGERTVEQPATSASTTLAASASTKLAAFASTKTDRADDPEPDGRTALLDVEPGDDRTQVIPVGLGRFGSPDGERTQVIGGRGELEGKTQVITAARAGERTTSGTVTPPAEHTQVLGIPVAGTPGERTTVRRTAADRQAATGPAPDDDRTADLTRTADDDRTADLTRTADDDRTADRTASTADEDRTADLTARTPDGDQTTAAIPAPRKPKDDETTTVLGPASWRGTDEPTTDLNGGKGDDRENTRPMTVGGLERPADEVAADTARRTEKPARQSSAAVPAQPSRSRPSRGTAHDDEPTRQL